MESKTDRIIYWAPRILAILFIAFLSLFSLDVFDMGLGLWKTVLGLLMHNIPSFVILACLLLAWKHEGPGGIAFIAAGTAYIGGLLATILSSSPRPWQMLTWSLYIAAPAFLIGALFIIGWYRKKKKAGPK